MADRCPLPPFDRDRPCPKCARVGARAGCAKAHPKPKKGLCSWAGRYCSETGEHIHRCCSTWSGGCGYGWVESVADAAECAAPPEEE